jgi:hypothetical protein
MPSPAADGRRVSPPGRRRRRRLAITTNVRPSARCVVRCPPVAVSGHAFRCVLVLVSKDQRKFKVGIGVPDPRLYTTKYNKDIPQS